MMELTWHGPKNGPGEAAGRSVPPSVPQLNFLQNMGWTRRQSSCSQKPGTVAVTHLVASLGVKSPLFHLRRCSFNHWEECDPSCNFAGIITEKLCTYPNTSQPRTPLVLCVLGKNISVDWCKAVTSVSPILAHFPPQYPCFTLPPHPCSCSIPLSVYLYLCLPSHPSLLDPISVIRHLVQVPLSSGRPSIVGCLSQGQVIIIWWAAAHLCAVVHSSTLWS